MRASRLSSARVSRAPARIHCTLDRCIRPAASVASANNYMKNRQQSASAMVHGHVATTLSVVKLRKRTGGREAGISCSAEGPSDRNGSTSDAPQQAAQVPAGAPQGAPEAFVDLSHGNSAVDAADDDLWRLTLISEDVLDAPWMRKDCARKAPPADPPAADKGGEGDGGHASSDGVFANKVDSGTRAAPPPWAGDSAADRLRLLHRVSMSEEDEAPRYTPTSPMKVARDRYLTEYLPYDWQGKFRAGLGGIPVQQFSYIVSAAAVVGTAFLSGVVAFEAFPAAHEVVLLAFDAASPEARTLQEMSYEAQYLGTVSFVTATMLGNTFGWTFARQQQLVAALGEEVFALELLLQELFIEIPEPYLRWRVIKHIKVYIDEEMDTKATDSPFVADGAISSLLQSLMRLKCEDAKDIRRLVECTEMLAKANSHRQGIAAAGLPPLHWVMLGALCLLVLVAFVLFDSDFQQPIAENRVIFAVVAAMLCTILLVLKDISDPDRGIYSLRDPLENRLSYVRWQMTNILSDPVMKLSMSRAKGPEADKPDVPEEEAGGAVASVDGASRSAARTAIRRMGEPEPQPSADSSTSTKLPPWLK